MVHKFKEVLEVRELDPQLIRDALKTLNELVHHQETSDQMIDADILTITAELLNSEESEVREQSALLLGSFALSAIGRQFFGYAFPNMKTLLEDEVLAVRTATAWAFK
jgi:HEAT repeat protein